MATSAKKDQATPAAFDWALLTGIIIFGGSAFAMIRGALESMPPILIVVGRLWVGAFVLYLMMRIKGRKFPSFMVRTKDGPRVHKAWAYMVVVGVTGAALPFFIFPWAQRYIDSGLAGVYMAFMPIWTLLLAYFFTDEKLTRNKLAGFVLGFAGVVILMGPTALSGALDASLLAQGALLVATLLYAISAVTARRAPTIRPRVFSAGMVLSAAVAVTPSLFFVDFNTINWTWQGALNVAGLGLFPTGLGGLIIVILIKRVGASFMALSNYITPIFAVVMGAVIFGERLGINVLIALGVILSGVYVSQRPSRRPPRA